MHHYDDLIIGSGIAGLTVASLLAQRGRRVGVFEAHDTPGGYAQTFTMGKFHFCAQVHYIFGCGEGEPINRLLRRLDLHNEITFQHLDRNGYDHIVVAGDRHKIPTGLDKYRDALILRYPNAERALRRYFQIIVKARDELAALPDNIGLLDLLSGPLRFPTLIRYRKSTLQQLFDRLDMPPRLQAVLAGQAGDYLLPPNQVSFLLHVALITSYDSGAYYPTHHFSSVVDGLVKRTQDPPGCDVRLSQPIKDVECEGKRVHGVVTANGERFTAERYISNADPAMTMGLLRGFEQRYRRRPFEYDYSSSNFTLYLGLRNIDLREHGFGNHNVWHYPSEDLNAIYERQGRDHDLSDPWLFLSTPTLHTDQPGLAPPGHHVLEVATSCDYEHFARLRRSSPKAYTQAKVKIRDRILEVIEDNYIPGLRKNLSMKVAGTPLTNERFVRAPRGNAYGANLTWQNMFPRVDHQSPLDNLWFVNATAGFPSVGGTVGAGMRLYEQLEGEVV